MTKPKPPKVIVPEAPKETHGAIRTFEGRVQLAESLAAAGLVDSPEKVARLVLGLCLACGNPKDGVCAACGN